MWTSDAGRRLPLLVLFALVAFGGCSDSPTDTPSDQTPAPTVEILDDLTASIQSMLVGAPTDFNVTMKFTLPSALILEEVTLYQVDEAGEAVTVLGQLHDDGAAANSDIIPGDDVYSGRVSGLEYDTPQTLCVRVLIEVSDAETLAVQEHWSAVVEIDVLSTELVFISQPVTTPQGFFASTMTDLTVITSLAVTDSLSLESLCVYRVNAAGDSSEIKGVLRDNGDLENMDEIQGDGIYTGIVHGLFVVAPQTYYLRALATAVSDSTGLYYHTWSSLIEIPVEYPAAQGSLDNVLANLEQAESFYELCCNDGQTEAQARAAVIVWLQEQQHVVEAYLSPDEVTIWTVYWDGLQAGVYLPGESCGDVFGGGRPGRSPLPVARERYASVRSSVAASPLQARDMGNPDEAQSNLAIILSPFHTWINSLGGESDACDEVCDLFMELPCPWSFDVDYHCDNSATVDCFAELYRYGAICIATHGTLLAGGQACLLTGEPVTLARVQDWYWDLYGSDPTMALVRCAGASYFAVKSSFIVKYNPVFPNSMVYVSACQGMRYSTLEQAFLGGGAGYMAGFDEAVGVPYANTVTLSFWDNVLTGGYPAGSAHDNVSPLSDPGPAGASFVGGGNAALHFGTGFKNGSFELGSLASWRTEGDGRVISQLGSERPFEGNYMGIVSTGLGFTVSTGEVSQPVCVPAGGATLEFDYNFFSEEFLEWCGSGFQDYFQVSVIPRGGSEDVIFYIHIDDMCDAVTPATIQFDQGPWAQDPVGVYKTGWLHASVDLSAYAGEQVTLRLAAGDIGDSIYDSAILLDEITIDTGE